LVVIFKIQIFIQKKIFPFNPEIQDYLDAQTNHNIVFLRKFYTLNLKEKILLENLLSTLNNIPKLSFSTAVFDPYGLDIVLYMLSWPLEKTWPVIDLIRVLVLQESAASYYSKVKEDNLSLLNIIIYFIKVTDLSPTHLQLCIKVIINLFRQPVFHISLLIRSYDIISTLASIMAQLPQTQEVDPKITLLCVQVFQNYSRLWFTGPPFRQQKHYDSIKILIRSAIQLLNNPAITDEIKISLLISLGTIIRNDSRIYVQVKQLEHLLLSPNPIIQECIKYILESL